MSLSRSGSIINELPSRGKEKQRTSGKVNYGGQDRSESSGVSQDYNLNSIVKLVYCASLYVCNWNHLQSDFGYGRSGYIDRV